jgi:ATP-dependent Lon protease
MNNLNDIPSNTKTKAKKSYYNTRKKNVKYVFENENENERSDDLDYVSDPDYDIDSTDIDIDSDSSYDIEDKKIYAQINNDKIILKYINKYIEDKTYHKKSNNNNNKNKNNNNNYKFILKEKAHHFYNNLVKNQSHLDLNQLYYHIDYFIDSTLEEQQTILNTYDTIINLTDTKIPRLFKILNSTLDVYYKKVALSKIQMLDKMKSGESDYFKLSNWIDTFLEIPFNKYKIPKYLDKDIISTPSKYLIDAQQHLDTIIYGQQKTKTHIIEILAKMITNPKTNGSVFAIHGEAGTGKTTLIKDGLSEVFGLPFIFISLGGAQDRTFLSGSNYVYEGSTCGKILQSLKQTQCMNPIFYFDELDKVSTTDKGQEIINMLIHLTDYSQNNHFMDDYMDGIAIDLSRATFVFSFNEKIKISPILLDRMEIIKFNSYSFNEKLHIAKSFLLPTIIKNIFGDKKENSITINTIITDDQMKKIVSIPLQNRNKHKNSKNNKNNKNNKNSKINNNTIYNKIINKNKYGGVRYIKKRLEKIVSKINVDLIMNKK